MRSHPVRPAPSPAAGLVLLALTALGSASVGLPVTPAAASSASAAVPQPRHARRRPPQPRPRCSLAPPSSPPPPDGEPSVQRPSVAAAARPGPDLLRTEQLHGRHLPRLLGHRLRRRRGRPGLRRRGGHLPCGKRRTRLHDPGQGHRRRHLGLGGPWRRQGDQVQPPGRHHRHGGPAGHARDADRPMGHSGDIAPCTTNYLHFEVRTGGVTGARVDPGTMLACTASGRIRMPDARGVTSWNDPRLPARQVMTPSGNIGLHQRHLERDAGHAGHERPLRPQSATVAWNAPPTGANRVVVLQELWSPSLHRYGWPTYVVLPVTSRSRTFTGLSNGRTYRYQVAFHNSYGNSAWSGGPHRDPGIGRRRRRRLLASSPRRRRTTSTSGGGRAPTTGARHGYHAARRCLRNGVYGAWVYVTVVASDVYYTNFRGLSGITTCQVKVRAAEPGGQQQLVHGQHDPQAAVISGRRSPRGSRHRAAREVEPPAR